MSTARSSIQGTSARYEPLFKLAAGGMATVYVGRLFGDLGFQRLVAIKRPHRHLVEDPRSLKTLLDEARLASRIQHPNVVSIQDVVLVDGALYLIMDWVEGASMSELQKTAEERSSDIPAPVAVRMLLDTCAGLHAAHELRDDAGAPLGLVHRDVSPHNVLVGVDGVARVSDFGIAKCVNVHGASTTTGTLKGKYGYMSPEHILGQKLDRRADVFALGVVAWELLAGRRLFLADSPGSTMMKIVHDPAPLLSQVTDRLGCALDDVLAQALAKEPEERFLSAEALAAALEASARKVASPASATEVGKWTRLIVGEQIDERKRQAASMLEQRAQELRDAERPTEPLPEPAAVDQVSLQIAPGRDEQTESVTTVYAESSRPAVVPGSISTATPSGSHAPSIPAKPARTWLYVIMALLFGGAGTLALQHIVAASPIAAEQAPAASVQGAPEESSRAPDSDSAAQSSGTRSDAAIQPSAQIVTVAPARTAAHPEQGYEAGASPSQAKSASSAVPPLASATGAKRPPPNPYAIHGQDGGP